MSRLFARRVLAALALPLLLTACDSGGPDQMSDDPDIQRLIDAFDCGVTEVQTDRDVTGSLASGDCQFDDDSFIDYYAFRLDASATVVIEYRSTAIDPYLFLYNSTGAQIDDNDDIVEGVDFNSRIERTLSPGVYGIGANSYDAGETGAYTIRVSVE